MIVLTVLLSQRQIERVAAAAAPTACQVARAASG
jgi:hypothetical protein